MESVQIDILNPKAKKLLKNLADLNLIKIQKSTQSDFSELLKKFRSKSSESPSLDEITKEVEKLRIKRNAR